MRKVLLLVSFLVMVLLFAGCFTGSVTFTDLTPSANESTPTVNPEETPAPTPAPHFFTADLTMVSTDHSEYLEANDASDSWALLANAVCKGLPFVDVENADQCQAVLDVFYAGPLSDIAELTVEDDRIYIEYSEEGAADALTELIGGILNDTLSAEHNTLESLIALYRTVSLFEYEKTDEVSVYRTLTECKGSGEELALALRYLFTQAGFNAKLAYAPQAEHYWVIAELDGSYFHFDPVFESAATSGLGLSYFGMSDTAHTEAIGSSAYQVGFKSIAEPTTGLCTSDLLDSLFSDVSSYELNVPEHTVSVQFGFESANTAEYNTKSFGH